MQKPILSRVQRNEVAEATKAAGLDPGDFSWSDQPGKRYLPAAERITHRPTGAFFSVSLADHGYSTRWWPDHRSGEGSERGQWPDLRPALLRWLLFVKEDHEAPDLWAEIAKARIVQTAAADEDYLKPFAQEELKLLESGLDDLERFTLSQQPPSPDEGAIKRRFAYLKDAARHATRKIDWLNLFVGQVVGMITEGLLSPTLYAPIMRHAATAFNAVYQFGVRLLES